MAFKKKQSVDVVSIVDVDWAIDPNAADPVLLQTDQAAMLIVNAPMDEPYARVALYFDGCGASRLGYPNEDPALGHPLKARGLRWSALNEVAQSSWLAELRERNRSNFPDHDLFTGYRHLVLPMRDSLFECLCLGYRSATTDEPIDALAVAFLSGQSV